jgi:hypothetical protein
MAGVKEYTKYMHQILISAIDDVPRSASIFVIVSEEMKREAREKRMPVFV